MTLDLKQVQSYFDDKIQAHGANPQGLDYRDEASQQIRFAQFLPLFSNLQAPFSINDFGCGYGGLYDYLCQQGYQASLHYVGYEVSDTMLNHAKQTHFQALQCQFQPIKTAQDMAVSDFSIACGVFNVKLDNPNEAWLNDFILPTLHALSQKSKKGFGFNLLTRYSDSDKMQDRLYYGDPCFLFDYCKTHFSRNVALLHDYDLYDFTILVRQ